MNLSADSIGKEIHWDSNFILRHFLYCVPIKKPIYFSTELHGFLKHLLNQHSVYQSNPCFHDVEINDKIKQIQKAFKKDTPQFKSLEECQFSWTM